MIFFKPLDATLHIPVPCPDLPQWKTEAQSPEERQHSLQTTRKAAGAYPAAEELQAGQKNKQTVLFITLLKMYFV